MGKPVLGENCRLEVIIEESYDFKVIFLGLQLPGVLPESLPTGESKGINRESHRDGQPRDKAILWVPPLAPWTAHTSLFPFAGSAGVWKFGDLGIACESPTPVPLIEPSGVP